MAPGVSSSVELAPLENSDGADSVVQATLQRIWAQVLGLSEVGVHEDFFELGGDSLLSIRILARANQEGLRISPEQFFALPTVAQQAANVGATGEAGDDQRPTTGKVPYTPIQYWFFEKIQPDPAHWNQSFLFSLKHRVDVSALERAVQSLLQHHDALRLQPGANNPGEQRIVELSATVPVSEVDFSQVTEADQTQAIDELATQLNGSFDLTQAPLLRVALIRTGANAAQKLLLIAHHLIVDGVSWRILLEDLEHALRCIENEEPIALPRKTSSIKNWARRLVQHADSDQVRAEFEFWRRFQSRPNRTTSGA